MLVSTIKNYDELPLYLNAKIVSQILGISLSSAYELMHEKDFPTIQIGSRFVVAKDDFIKWVDAQLESRNGE